LLLGPKISIGGFERFVFKIRGFWRVVLIGAVSRRFLLFQTAKIPNFPESSFQ